MDTINPTFSSILFMPFLLSNLMSISTTSYFELFNNFLTEILGVSQSRDEEEDGQRYGYAGS